MVILYQQEQYTRCIVVEKKTSRKETSFFLDLFLFLIHQTGSACDARKPGVQSLR